MGKEHQSGLVQAIIASLSGFNVSANNVATTLNINRKTAQKAKRKRLQFETAASYIPLLSPSAISRIRIPTIFATFISDWIEHNTTPSSKVENVIKYVENGISKIHQLHYRTVPIETLYNDFLEDHPQINISSSYFYSNLPPWLCMKTQRSGLCIYHDKAVRLVRILLINRSTWHVNCNCNCEFCRFVFTFVVVSLVTVLMVVIMARRATIVIMDSVPTVLTFNVQLNGKMWKCNINLQNMFLLLLPKETKE
jgi:hypothetical protein